MTAKEPLEERIDEILKVMFNSTRPNVALPQAKQALLSAFRDEQVALIERIPLGCEDCGRRTVFLAADLRNFDRGKCSDCKGPLITTFERLDAIKAEVEGKGE